MTICLYSLEKKKSIHISYILSTQVYMCCNQIKDMKQKYLLHMSLTISEWYFVSLSTCLQLLIYFLRSARMKTGSEGLVLTPRVDIGTFNLSVL